MYDWQLRMGKDAEFRGRQISGGRGYSVCWVGKKLQGAWSPIHLIWVAGVHTQCAQCLWLLSNEKYEQPANWRRLRVILVVLSLCRFYIEGLWWPWNIHYHDRVPKLRSLRRVVGDVAINSLQDFLDQCVALRDGTFHHGLDQ